MGPLPSLSDSLQDLEKVVLSISPIYTDDVFWARDTTNALGPGRLSI